MKKEPIKFDDIEMAVPSQKRVEAKIAKFIEELKGCGSAKTALSVIKKFAKYGDELSTEVTVIQIRYSLATDDPVCQRANDKLDQMLPLIQAKVQEWNQVLAKAKYRKDLEKVLGKYYFTMIDNSLKAFDPKIIPELQEENSLTSEYDRVMGSAQIPFREGTYNLSQLGKFTTSSDRETRKEATIALDKWLGEHEEEIGGIYDRLVKVRDKMAKALGFKNFVPLGYLRLGRCDYNPKMVKNYRDQVSETVVPLCQKLYKKQAARLGIPMKEMVSYDYNVNFLSGNPVPAGDEKFIVEKATGMYHSMSEETGKFFDFMKEYHLLDLTARKGKAPGGYMTYLPSYKEPFIFSNFNGTQGDIEVITHEVGHAFQGYMSSGIKIPEYRSPTLEACEIHSMSMEFFAYPYVDAFFKGDDGEKYRFAHLEGAIEFLPYGITVDEFQHWVYEHPEATHAERCAEWQKIERAYTPHKVYTDLPTFAHGGYWMRQSHIFTTAFYYIDYTLAQVVAFQFYNEMRKNKEKAWKKYVKLCKFGGKEPFVGLLEKNHLRNPFEDGNVAKAVKPAFKALSEMDESKIK